MKLIIELPDKKVISLRKCAESGMELDATHMAVVNGVPYEERKTGEWIHKPWEGGYYCSICGRGGWIYHVSPRWKACPWCGVNMEVDE